MISVSYSLMCLYFLLIKITSYGSIFNSTIGGAVFLLSTFYGAVHTTTAFLF